MADDLDELLDEVETKFCRNISVKSPSSPVFKKDGGFLSATKKKTEGKVRTHGSSKPESPKKGEEDIDDFLKDIFDDRESLNLDVPEAAKNETRSSLLQPASRKCCPVFLGGSSIPSGVGTSTSQRACSELRCTACDFRVAAFDDCEWDASCDYLFFRNNMPDCDKLRTKLRRKRGARAYACQCSWLNAFHLTDRHQCKWVCGKHQA